MHNGHIFSRVESQTRQSVARDEISGAAKASYRHGAAFELFGGFDFRLGHQPVIERCDTTDDVNRFRACEPGAHDTRAGGLNHRCIARDHGGYRGCPAREVYRLCVEIVLGKDAGIARHPDDQLVGTDTAVTDRYFGRLRMDNRSDSKQGPSESGYHESIFQWGLRFECWSLRSIYFRRNKSSDIREATPSRLSVSSYSARINGSSSS